MAPELLVDERVKDGGRLATALVRDGFDVTAAFWIRTQEEGLWFLYFATPAVKSKGFANAYHSVYATLSRLAIETIELSQLKLVDPVNPVAVEAIAIRDRYPVKIPTRLGSGRLGGIAIEEAYIYPRVGQALTRSEVMQAVTALMNRTGIISPSSLTLRDGSTFLAIPVGIRLSHPGGVMITLHEHATGRNRDVSADDITAIQ